MAIDQIERSLHQFLSLRGADQRDYHSSLNSPRSLSSFFLLRLFLIGIHLRLQNTVEACS